MRVVLTGDECVWSISILHTGINMYQLVKVVKEAQRNGRYPLVSVDSCLILWSAFFSSLLFFLLLSSLSLSARV